MPAVEHDHLVRDRLLAQARLGRGDDLGCEVLILSPVDEGQPDGAQPISHRGEVRIGRQLPTPEHEAVHA